MWPDSWAVVAESERAQWDYVPLERVGPLRFGMSLEDATAVMGTGGFLSDTAAIGKFGPYAQQRIQFRGAGMPFHRVAVVAFHVESMGLTCIAVDALTGPQVTLDGLRLIGRRPSELDGELSAYLDKLGKTIEIAPWDSVGSSELGVLPRPQRAGDILLTRGVFGRPNAWANTMFDCIPAEEGMC